MRATLLAAAAIIAAQADRTGNAHWHAIADRLTDHAQTMPEPQEES